MGVDLDKLYTSAVYKLESDQNPFNKVLLDKVYVQAVYRGPEVGIGSAGGIGIARAFSEVILALLPETDDSLGGWTNQVGAGVLAPSIAKTAVNDSTYIVADPEISNDTARIKFETPDYEFGDEVYVTYRYSKFPAGTTQQVDLTVRLVQGISTVIASWAHTDISTSLVSIIQTLTAPQVAAITDFNDLYIEFISQST